MSDHASASIHIDGAARGNPGPAAFAFVIARGDAPPIEENGLLGTTTNNQAEYTALVKALERAAGVGADRLVIHSDSELLVKQMRGEYRVKNPELRVLHDQARALFRHFKQVTFVHVPRAQNRRADSLCNEALDGKKSASVMPGQTSTSPPSARMDAVREEAVNCLRTVAACWARGNADNPSPEIVWDQLWAILDENGVLKRR